ncbi:NAD(P)-dependent dehydrogenase, short-chain alcohol dehydrogenase family [Dietzia kunjamensis subsp. schimae]|uniref:NAD(P)-dependent dehydrogenase, short-chain alcohol dehydrogenase family n=1 Tax=Dietzia kunjamensis subsp. schimae TaxID=498198 RepID=A0ABY1N3H9_9ACTN|nr:SDR family oxidoreductase [Dietzia kunjamensis]MBB1014799.1 SDR family oxidoreductase [Dietzia kunjamensis subsp. schimae]SMO70249.1 NAD(P)-dependent dehydrogenase, short-chain alcohol dehydrogenase family [Dietzia kunjamensis subsp. schimae]
MDIPALFSLDGRVALVTGGSRGIGRMIAEGLLAQGATVYITARKEEACRATAAELSSIHGDGRCVALPHDISTTAGIAALLEAFREHEDHLDVLVNNAGAAWGEPFDDFSESGWDKVMDLNVKAPFFLTQAAKGLLLAGRERTGHLAKVINIASIDGLSLNPMETYSYHASKAGIVHLTKRMAVRLAPEGIIVSAIAPGAFASNMNKEARDHGDEITGQISSGRIGRPEDMAGAAVYLASDAGDYVVGSTLTVDGGVTIAR